MEGGLNFNPSTEPIDLLYDACYARWYGDNVKAWELLVDCAASLGPSSRDFKRKNNGKKIKSPAAARKEAY